ncbi:Sucrose-6-phosphate hydrolase [Carnimonas sp. R-84981]|uniref:glycoside hydrolase family 32 protein n=1 Tax=Carnimonas bestiolae TaxID=3402172 RepID=UPI003EDBF6BA
MSANDQHTHHTQLERAQKANDALAETRKARWYPHVHIAATAGWINDPNGLSFFNGRYQAYFQHHPYGSQWGPMHWGHVSSTDMVHWQRHPIALAPSIEADRDGVFSGSAVAGPDGLLYAFYTGHRWRNGNNEDDGNLQVQCLAVSKDGCSFEKRGTVIDCPEGISHFRDPKVWYQEGRWWMVVGVSSREQRGEVWLYASSNLTEWRFERVLFQAPEPSVFMLECPDMFPLGDKWVLLYCPMGLAKTGFEGRNGHNAGYVVGDWAPGQAFTPLTSFRPLDWGHQFYAPQTFETPDGRRAMFGWMGAFNMALPPQAEDGWCGQLTVPRELRLGSDLHLYNLPIAEFSQLRTRTLDLGALILEANQTRVIVEECQPCEIALTIDLDHSSAERIGLWIGQPNGSDGVLIAYDDQTQRVVVDRGSAQLGDRGYRAAPCASEGKLELRILIDTSSVEVFINNGHASITSFVFPVEGQRSASLRAESGTATIDSVVIHSLSSIWR